MANITTLKAGLAAEATGLDVRTLADGELSSLKSAFADHGLLILRDQTLTPDDHIAWAERWGEINVNRFFKAVDGYPRIAEVRKEPDQTTNIGGGWHTDHSYDIEPALGSILYAKELPPTGGDTIFASMYLAYEDLSDGLKETLASLNAVHSSRHVFGPGRYDSHPDVAGRLGGSDLATQDAVHPIVITHPLSGRKALYVNPGFTTHIEGWTPEESAPLLGFLYEHAITDDFTYRLKWQPGTVAFWDNRATWHKADNDYHGERRLMHRITIEGEALSP